MSVHTLLLVDDDPAVHELLAAVLRRPDWSIDSAYDGLQGLARAQARAYDVVLTGVRLPGLNGLELLHQIREIRPEAKVMVMTAESTPDNIVRAIREQAFSYFSKPFSPSSVADMITQAVNTATGRTISKCCRRLRNGSACGCAARWRLPTG